MLWIKLCCKFFLATRSNKIPLNELVLQEKANDLARALNMDNLVFNMDTWLDIWKSKNNVTFKAISGKAKSCSPEITAHCKKTHLPTILSRQKLTSIFNVDEFEQFFQPLLNKTLELKSEKCIVFPFMHFSLW